MNRDQMLKALFDGKKVRKKEWRKDRYVYFDPKKNKCFDSNGKEAFYGYYLIEADESIADPYELYEGDYE